MEFLKVIEQLSLLGGSLYALRWMTGKAEAAAATCDTVRREKDTQIFELIGKKEDREAQLVEDNRQRLIDLTHEKDAQLDRLRAELDTARIAQRREYFNSSQNETMSKKPEFRKTYHISGHLDLTEEQFAAHYIPQLEAAIQESAAFVVGDARGADARAIHYLMGQGFFYNGRLTVYHMFDAPRNGEGCTQKVGGFKTDEERDSAMTNASDADLYWLNPAKGRVTGTHKNVLRRQAKQS